MSVSLEMTETYFSPCSPRPFWPYSSAPQRHKWRHPVSCREWGKWENYNKEMEISDLELNDNRGTATSVQNDRWWKNQWGQTESGGTSFATTFSTVAQRVIHHSGDVNFSFCKRLNRLEYNAAARGFVIVILGFATMEKFKTYYSTAPLSLKRTACGFCC